MLIVLYYCYSKTIVKHENNQTQILPLSSPSLNFSYPVCSECYNSAIHNPFSHQQHRRNGNSRKSNSRLECGRVYDYNTGEWNHCHERTASAGR